MKTLKIISTVIFISLCYIMNAKGSISVKDIKSNLFTGQIDSFEIYYQQLEEISKKNPYDTSSACATAVRYMEITTQIKAHADGNYFGWVHFTKIDLILWREWKRKNTPTVGL